MFECNINNCKYTSKTSPGLISHKANIHDVNVKWYKCEFKECDYKSKTNSDLTRHDFLPALKHGVSIFKGFSSSLDSNKLKFIKI
jgi:hypothetical protein